MSLENWCRNPPDNVVIKSAEISENRVRIRFFCQQTFDKAAECIQSWPFTVLVQDGTFETNYLKLVLVGVSLAGNVVYNHDSHVRCLPGEFVLADKGDAEAFQSVLEGTRDDFNAANKIMHVFMDASQH